MGDQKHLEELTQFIREHRGNEQHFDALFSKLQAETEAEQSFSDEAGVQYKNGLQEALDKYAVPYKENREKGISTWSEFETFVSYFEKSVIEAMHGN
jgi:hypothetical protein